MRKAGLKRAAAFLLCVALLSSMAVALGTGGFPFIGYTAELLKLRQQPSSTADTLLTIPKGEALAVMGADGSYYIVEYQGRQGYALQSFVTKTPPAAQFEGLPTPAPVDAALEQRYPTLLSGASGAQVKALQEALQELRFHSGKVDGKYGPATEKSVRAFQKMNALPENGIADPKTQQKLFEGTVKNASGRVTPVKTLPAVEGQILRPGDRGDLVSELQRLLKAQGYYKGTVDGRYGGGTERAVRELQRAKKLRVDGKAGPDTLAALKTPEQSQAPSAPTTAPQQGPTQAPAFADQELPPATYPYTTTASAAVNLRKAASINSARILTVPLGASVSVLSSSGDYLKVTYKKYTGYVVAEFINIPEQYLAGGTLPFNSDARIHYEALAVGSSGVKVKALQQALRELGFYKGEIDSRFGAGTLAALKSFQEKNKLRATGVALPELQQLINEKRPRNARNLLTNLKVLPPIPGYPMQQGDVGDAVTELHSALKQLGFYAGELSDSYSNKTTSAVKLFQKAHSIRQTGKMDSFTTLALNTAMGSGLAEPETGPAVTPAPTPLTEDNVIVLRPGTSGVLVTAMQQRLVALKYYSIAPDGVFGAKDSEALKAFQIRNQLRVNGIADLATQLVLNSPSALAALPSTGLPQVTAAPQPSVLRIGSTGDAVTALQARLITLSYLSGKADGIYGTQTAKALTGFQKKNGLRADGVAGQATLGLLYSAKAVANTGATAPSSPSGEEDAGSTLSSLRLGDSGSPVKAMQQRLVDLKYMMGGADGIFGPKTFLALQNFQRNNRLQPDGIAGRVTLTKLSDPRAIAASGLADLRPTPTPAPTQSPQQPQPGGFTAPRAAEVRLADWYDVLRPRVKAMPKVIVYDFMSGTHYRVNIFSIGKHADGEPPTVDDTRAMEKALGYNNWDPRPVWIIFSDGRVYMASTHSHGHEVDHNANNGLTGHICIHFPRKMEDAIATGPYAVAHQNAILAGWDLTQSMAR